MRLTIQVTKTSDGTQEYVQIMSDDMFSINVVLIADQIAVTDDRPGMGPTFEEVSDE